jgi:hypothetical protein
MINLHPTKTRRQGKKRTLLNLEMKHKFLDRKNVSFCIRNIQARLTQGSRHGWRGKGSQIDCKHLQERGSSIVLGAVCYEVHRRQAKVAHDYLIENTRQLLGFRSR